MTRDHPSGPPLGRPAHPRRGADSPGAELPLSHESPTQDPGKLLDTFPTYPGQARCNCTVMAIVTAWRPRRSEGPPWLALSHAGVTAGDGERAARRPGQRRDGPGRVGLVTLRRSKGGRHGTGPGPAPAAGRPPRLTSGPGAPGSAGAGRGSPRRRP